MLRRLTTQVAITSPDPEFNTDAKEYLTRHMRLLECCAPAWPAQDLQNQILSLRQAFSADTTKPFELKSSFPYGSPITGYAPSPPAEAYDRNITSHPTHDPIQHYHSGQMTPPISAGHGEDLKENSMAAASMLANGRSTSLPPGQMGDDNGRWNPTPIFEYEFLDTRATGRKIANPRKSQWHTAFGTPPPSNMVGTPMAPPYSPTASTVSHDLSHVENMSQPPYSVTSNMTPISQIQGVANTYSPPTSHPNSYVSPSMWRDTVANTYVPNDLKRRWDGVGGPAWDGQQQVKRPR
jgi:hypothetical protein